MPTDYGAQIPRVALSLADTAAQGLRLGDGPLDARLVERAEARAGRPFRSRDFEPALSKLADSLHREADLNLLGRLSFRWDAMRLLRNALQLETFDDGAPAIVEASIDAPLFVTGLPRSGTTFLHRLLALDPQNRAPLCYETMQPYPDSGGGRDRRARRAELQFRSFARIAPGVRRLHPLSATTPQECTEITAHVFQSLRFDTLYHVPSYLAWLERRGHVAAFSFHRRFLQHLQAQSRSDRPPRWVLKCPDHVFALKDILTVYPDARFVFLHRDPAAVLPSVAKLTEVLRAPFVRKPNPLAIGAEVGRRLAQGATRILEAGELLPQSRVLHLRYDEITTAPLGALEQLYGHFGLELRQDVRASVQSFLERTPRGGYEVNRYDPAAFGLDLGRTRREMAAYIDAFARPAQLV